MKKMGQLLWAKSNGIELKGVVYGEGNITYYFAKLATNQYLIIFDAIFTKDPFKRKYRIITERKFKSLIKNHTLQSS